MKSPGGFCYQYYLFSNAQRFIPVGSQRVKIPTMSKLFIAFALLLTLFSCSKKDSNDAHLPAGIQQAIAGYTSCTCDPYIKLYTWRGQSVYLQYILGPLCNGIPIYYDANGERLTMEAGYTLDMFLAESVFVRTVWECSQEN